MSKNSPKLEDKFKLIASGILRQNRCLHSRWKLARVRRNEGGERRRKERHTAAVMAAGGRQEEEKETMKEEGDRIFGE